MLCKIKGNLSYFKLIIIKEKNNSIYKAKFTFIIYIRENIFN